MERSVRVSMVLAPPARGRDGVERLRELASDLGLEVTGSGRATMSFRISPEAFEALFGSRPETVAAEPPGEGDFGAPGGHAAAGELPVPPQLRDLVRAIAVEPPAHRLENPDAGPSNPSKEAS